MRTIKFRVWDKEHNQYLPEGVYAITNKTEHNSFGIMLIDWENYKAGEFFYDNAQILEEWAGLTDKNGREIWEGDRLMVSHNLQRFDPIIVKVEFRNFCWMCGKTKSLYNYSTMDSINIEVIGNIHDKKQTP